MKYTENFEKIYVYLKEKASKLVDIPNPNNHP